MKSIILSHFSKALSLLVSIDSYVFLRFESLVGKSSDDTTRNLYYVFRFALISTLIVLILNLFLRLDIGAFANLKLGDFGDFFGGVLNPILTFLMFIGLIITIIIQKNELALSRIEFNRTANALKEQSDSSKQQIFDNSFFNLLKIHGDTLESLKFNDKVLHCALNYNQDDSIGRAAISSVLSWISNFDHEGIEKIHEHYQYLQDNENHIVGHYFRGFYQILKFIDDAEILDSEKEKYSRIFRAQLSTNELALLYFNCLCPSVDDGKFKELLIKFKMLEHINLRKVDPFDYYAVCAHSAYTTKEDLLKYIDFDESGRVRRSAFGTNPLAILELYDSQPIDAAFIETIRVD